MAPKKPDKRIMAKYMKAMTGRHEAAKTVNQRSTRREHTGERGRVRCPKCDHGNTHIIGTAKNGDKKRECNACNLEFTYPR